MLDQVIAAFDRQDYPTAARLLKVLLKQSPENPWVLFYVARLQEIGGKLDAAETIYRRLLQQVTTPKLVSQARQGMQRTTTAKKEQQSGAIDPAQAIDQLNSPESDDGPVTDGFLVLKTVSESDWPVAIQAFAQVMNLDPYTARMLVPHRGWRLYRIGPIAELQVYGEALRQANLPVSWATLPEIAAIHVFQVQFIQTEAPQAAVVCRNSRNQLGSLSFAWAEVTQVVTGLLPIFEQVVDVGRRNQLERKQETQDYIHFCDLHLPDRRCILRLQESTYDFTQGIPVVAVATAKGGSAGGKALSQLPSQLTRRAHWNGLIDRLHHQLPHAVWWSEFTVFGETAADLAVPLTRLVQPHVNLLRQTETHWDAAFHLYSSLIFLRP